MTPIANSVKTNPAAKNFCGCEEPAILKGSFHGRKFFGFPHLPNDFSNIQAEAEVVPSSSLVEIDVGVDVGDEVEVGVGVEVEVGVEVGDEVGVEVRVGVGGPGLGL